MALNFSLLNFCNLYNFLYSSDWLLFLRGEMSKNFRAKSYAGFHPEP